MKKIIIRNFLIGYLVITFPITLCFLGNEYFRFQFFQTLSQLYSKFDNIDYVFIGDSITAGGRSWSTLINKPPFMILNLAGNGYTTRQIISQAKMAINYKPKQLFVLAGTNDVFAIKDSIYNLNRFEKDYKKLITSTLINKCQVVFTLIPYQSNMKNKTLIDSMNTISSRLLNKYNIKYININPIISKDGFLLNEFTTDGVHFSNKANRVWGEQLRRLIK